MIQLNFTIIINNNFAFIHCIHQQHFKINICIFNSDILICNICYQCCLNEECYSEIWILTGTKYINGGFLAVIFGVDKNAVLHASKHTTAKSNAAFTPGYMLSDKVVSTCIHLSPSTCILYQRQSCCWI